MDERNVYFTWDMIPAQEVPGTLLGYEIKYRKYHEETYQTAISPSNINQKTVSSFKPFTWYWVEVAGYTKAGVGPHQVFVFKMLPGRKKCFFFGGEHTFLLSLLFVMVVIILLYLHLYYNDHIHGNITCRCFAADIRYSGHLLVTDTFLSNELIWVTCLIQNPLYNGHFIANTSL